MDDDELKYKMTLILEQSRLRNAGVWKIAGKIVTKKWLLKIVVFSVTAMYSNSS